MAQKYEHFYISDVFMDREDGELFASILNEKREHLDSIDMLGDFEDSEDIKQALLDEADRKGYSTEKFNGFIGGFFS